MPAVLTETQNTVEWLGLRLVLPRPWEIVRHGVSGRKGSLAFADRRRQRLEHLVEGVRDGHASAVLAASIFHFGEHTIAEAKAHMARAGIGVRP